MKTPDAKKQAMIEGVGNDSFEDMELNKANRLNQKLRIIINRIKKVLDNIPQIAFVANSNGEDIYLNKKWHEYTGIPADEGMGMRWTGVVHPEDLPPENIWSDTKIAATIEFEYRILNSAGEYKWHLCRALPVHEGTVLLWIGTATDIHEKKEIEQQLLDEKNFIEKVVQANPDSIAIFNIEERKYKYLSGRVHDFTGKKPEELQSIEDFKKVIHPDDWQKFVRYHSRFNSMKDQEVKQIEFRGKAKKDDWRWFLKKGKAFKRAANGKVTHVVTITQDITERKEAEEERKENEVMHQLLVKKDEFLSEASHELKTPVTTIKSSLQIMKRLFEKHADEGTLLVFLVKANQQVNKLTDLISNIMDNSKIQAGQFILNTRSFYIDEVINDSIIHNPGRHRITVQNTVKKPVVADKHRIEQVLINFLTNAIKYSPEADKIIIRACEEEENLRVEVRDYGIGIPEEMMEKVFRRFFRVDHTSTHFSGIGLGLYISAEIIKLHHGEIGVENAEGQGSVFWFTIPFEQPAV